jgi:hypothetical protein
MNKIYRSYKALRQLGWEQVWPYLRYQFRLRSGTLQRQTPISTYAKAAEQSGEPYLPLFPLPNLGYLRAVLGEDSQSLLAEADEIIEGQVRLFGGEPRPLELTPPGELNHWTKHSGGQHLGEDIKLIWEPARFGWATTLARAYLLEKDNRYAEAFWRLTEEFAQGNPPNSGPHWASAQEVALRLIALTFSAGLMADAPATTPDRQILLAGMVAAHADRILPTLDYARAQNNNHLISESVGLYTAAVALPEHPHANKWNELGWRWLHHALQTQIAEDGTYSQHSTNYHRLMLQLALFAHRLAEEKMKRFPRESLSRLAAASCWLLSLLDNKSGGIPNLGGNDGAYILPLTSYPYADFRPVVQAAAQAFLDETPLPPGPGDEMTLWLGGRPIEEPQAVPNPPILRLSGLHSWATLRAAHFTSRPAHADQLHLDLWWRGINITPDAGVYQYNADAPWDNPLDVTAAHNTLTVDGLSQMTKAGRFLWLDWAQAEVLDTNQDERDRLTWAVAQHDGYRRLGIFHRRTVSVEGNTWLVRDQLLPVDEKKKDAHSHAVRLHWLLPDWEWQLNNGVLRLDSGQGDVVVQVRSADAPLTFSLVRAGESLEGEETSPTCGWFSPTYAEKVPALSLAVSADAPLPVTLTTRIELPD